jgi:hypothetical protein
VVLMNPPFSAMANVDRRMADTTLRHVSSALARLADGGRLVAITGSNFAPDNPAWTDAFVQLQERGRVVFSGAIDGSVYTKHGTTIDTRLTVIDKLPAEDRCTFPASPGMAPDAAKLLDWVMCNVPARLPIVSAAAASSVCRPVLRQTLRGTKVRPYSVSAVSAVPDIPEMAYDTLDWQPTEGGRITEALYE